MTEYDKLVANEAKEKRYRQALGQCEICHKQITRSEAQLAHRIPKHKKYILKWGQSVINHELNLMLTCPGCNSKAILSPATHPVEAQELVDVILADIFR